MTTNSIHGEIECTQPTSAKVEGRVQHFLRLSNLLGSAPGEHLHCNEMPSC